ncbi:MAG: MotA/TolQ/ExbB proton channel family protein [Opitutaceae bacterium]
MKIRNLLTITAALIAGTIASAQTYSAAASSAVGDLQKVEAELAALRTRIADEKIPISKDLNRLENEVLAKRREVNRVENVRDNRKVDLNALENEVQARGEQNDYVRSLLTEYIRAFRTRIHVSEIQKYDEIAHEAQTAVDDANLTEAEKFNAQIALVQSSLNRVQDIIGGNTFTGNGIVEGGLLAEGTYALVGPIGVFSSKDGASTGLAELQANSESDLPVIFNIGAQYAGGITALATTKAGALPVDPSLGNAIKIELTSETLWEHTRKGGMVIWFILGLAFLAILVAIFKWFEINSVKRPKSGDLQTILNHLNRGEKDQALAKASSVSGPFGELLVAGVNHADEEKELLEEILYERLLATQPKLERLLAFIALTAGAAPLLGLLGTVTGMIQTFKLITVFGTGDAKSLSSGISEALITTEYGLYVAIPALLAQALLSRKAKGTLSEMEQTSVAFVNGLANRRS